MATVCPKQFQILYSHVKERPHLVSGLMYIKYISDDFQVSVFHEVYIDIHTYIYMQISICIYMHTYIYVNLKV